jgi:hypothetical protein
MPAVQQGHHRRRGSQLGVAIPCLAAALLALAGCGGSSAPSKSEYVAKANAVCRELRAELLKVAESEGEIKTKARESVPPREKAQVKLKAITQPKGDKVPAEWLHYRDLAIAAEKELVPLIGSKQASAAAARRKATLAYFSALKGGLPLAKSYGLTDCSTGFAAG